MTAKRWMFACLALLGFALAGEFAVRRWLSRPQSTALDRRFGLVQEPGAHIVQSREGWGEYTANSFGFLDGELAPAESGAAGVLLGDSFGQALQVPYGRRFSEVVEQRLAGVSLLNAASAGRSPIHYALFAPRLQAAFHPDFVVLQLSDGDLSELEDPRLWREALDEFHATGHAADVARPLGSGPGDRLRAQLRESALLNMLFGRVGFLMQQERTRLRLKLTGQQADRTDVVALPVTPRAAAVADSLIGVVQAVNPNLVLLYVPHVHYFMSPPQIAYPERRAFYHALAERRGMQLVDPSDAMLVAFASEHEPLHGFANTKPAEGHLNERGHAIVGEQLAKAIERERAPGGRFGATSPVPRAALR